MYYFTEIKVHAFQQYIPWRGRKVSNFRYDSCRISNKTEIAFPHEPRIYYFSSRLLSLLSWQ